MNTDNSTRPLDSIDSFEPPDTFGLTLGFPAPAAEAAGMEHHPAPFDPHTSCLARIIPGSPRQSHTLDEKPYAQRDGWYRIPLANAPRFAAEPLHDPRPDVDQRHNPRVFEVVAGPDEAEQLDRARAAEAERKAIEAVRQHGSAMPQGALGLGSARNPRA